MCWGWGNAAPSTASTSASATSATDCHMTLYSIANYPRPRRWGSAAPSTVHTRYLSAGAVLLHTLTITDKKLSLIHISEPTRLLSISYAVFCLKKKNTKKTKNYKIVYYS
eukprot:TRINITY_DN12362_c0_g1_i1.p2 TRINITY_DN12362_c0_g1~~TRINITY_DN12362_c0_g1_i1.p2  ORF type:complete len:110 (+),score=16.82 TRINITY_DN12362_c0_g1_i1:464-793(+)